MEEKCSSAITQLLISLLPETKDKERIIKYGLELIITASIGLLLMACVSFAARKPLAWIAFILGFAPLRTTAGGFHASSHWRCYIITTITCAASIAFTLVGNITAWHYLAISGLSFLVMLIFSPVEAKNKPLSSKKRATNRCISLLIIGIELTMSLLLILCGIHQAYIDIFYYGILAASISIIAAKINNLQRKEMKR